MDNDDLFSSDFDPYNELLQAGSNINQLAIALNNQAASIEHLTRLHKHNAEVIQQLQFNDKKQRQQIQALQNDIITIKTDIELEKLLNETQSPT